MTLQIFAVTSPVRFVIVQSTECAIAPPSNPSTAQAVFSNLEVICPERTRLTSVTIRKGQPPPTDGRPPAWIASLPRSLTSQETHFSYPYPKFKNFQESICKSNVPMCRRRPTSYFTVAKSIQSHRPSTITAQGSATRRSHDATIECPCPPAVTTTVPCLFCHGGAAAAPDPHAHHHQHSMPAEPSGTQSSPTPV